MTKTNVKPCSDLTRKSESIEWDSEAKGLGLRSRGTTQTWIAQTRVAGKSRKKTIGSAGSISLEQARLEAVRLIDEWTGSGKDQSRACSVAAFAEKYLKDCAGQWKPTTQRGHSADITHRIIPHLGHRDLASITRADVVTWMASIDAPQSTKNRALAVLSGMMRHAELTGHRPSDSNPCKGLRRRKTGFVARFLSDEEWGDLGCALEACKPIEPDIVDLFRFLALTGCRRSEGRLLQWDMIEGKRAVLPDAKAGPRTIWLGKPARDILASRPKTCAYVFSHRDRPLTEIRINKAWHAIRDVAGLHNLRIHDLRHGFASVAVNARVGLRTIAGLLGHSDLETTAGYAHLAEDRIKEAATRVGSRLHTSLTGEKPSLAHADPIERFVHSKLKLSEFCKSENLDVTTFRSEVIAWRETNKEQAK